MKQETFRWVMVILILTVAAFLVAMYSYATITGKDNLEVVHVPVEVPVQNISIELQESEDICEIIISDFDYWIAEKEPVCGASYDVYNPCDEEKSVRHEFDVLLDGLYHQQRSKRYVLEPKETRYESVRVFCLEGQELLIL